MQPIHIIPLRAGRADTWARGTENNAVHLTYDMTAMLTAWPDAVPSVAFQRADGQKYAHAWRRDGAVLKIPLTCADTAVPGMCKVMITLTSGNGQTNTDTFYGNVTQGIDTLGDAPDGPEQGIIEQVNAAAARAEAAAERAESAGGGGGGGGSLDVTDDGAGHVTIQLYGLDVSDDGAGHVTIA